MFDWVGSKFWRKLDTEIRGKRMTEKKKYLETNKQNKEDLWPETNFITSQYLIFQLQNKMPSRFFLCIINLDIFLIRSYDSLSCKVKSNMHQVSSMFEPTASCIFFKVPLQVVEHYMNWLDLPEAKKYIQNGKVAKIESKCCWND